MSVHVHTTLRFQRHKRIQSSYILNTILNIVNICKPMGPVWFHERGTLPSSHGNRHTLTPRIVSNFNDLKITCDLKLTTNSLLEPEVNLGIFRSITHKDRSFIQGICYMKLALNLLHTQNSLPHNLSHISGQTSMHLYGRNSTECIGIVRWSQIVFYKDQRENLVESKKARENQHLQYYIEQCTG